MPYHPDHLRRHVEERNARFRANAKLARQVRASKARLPWRSVLAEWLRALADQLARAGGGRPRAGRSGRRTKVRWRLHLASAPSDVFRMLSTDDGRARFWAVSAVRRGETIDFVFRNGVRWSGRILEERPPRRFRVLYLEGTVTTFELEPDGHGGTDMTFTDAGVAADEWAMIQPGWISVLLALKAAVDFGIDLRNHDPEKGWHAGFIDN